ncbi:hypothetical protein ACFLZZ_04755 [Nanoarchaeota archaeon]
MVIKTLEKKEVVDHSGFHDYNPLEESKFSGWYNKVLKRDTQLKKDLVETNPYLAERVVNIFKDLEVGRLYVKKYENDEHRHHSAYFISLKISEPIKRQPRDLTTLTLPMEGVNSSMHKSMATNIPYCGNLKGDPDWIIRNSWDSQIKARESSN